MGCRGLALSHVCCYTGTTNPLPPQNPNIHKRSIFLNFSIPNFPVAAFLKSKKSKTHMNF